MKKLKQNIKDILSFLFIPSMEGMGIVFLFQAITWGFILVSVGSFLIGKYM